LSIQTQQVNWQDYATVKRWKTRLAINSFTQELSPSTWRCACAWMPQFMKFTKKSPDELIAEAKIDSDIGEEMVSKFFVHLKKTLSNNSAKNGAHGYMRGFYKHNKINTQNWHNPKSTVSYVKKIDAQYPMFVLNETTQKFDLNRTFLRSFLRELSIRDETFALCLISTGQDSGDILKLNVGFVRNQDSKFERLYLNDNRGKTAEELKVFFSREATKKIREYVRKERSDAADNEPLFITSNIERRRIFALEHKRQFREGDILPKGTRLLPKILSVSFRLIEQKLGIKMEKGQQSPLRPKRLRHVFRSACSYAGIEDDMVRVFLGQVGQSSKAHLGKSREELEFFYKLVEPKITIYNDEPVEEIEKLKKQLEETKKTDSVRIDELKVEQEKMKQEIKSELEFRNAFLDYTEIGDTEGLKKIEPETLEFFRQWKALMVIGKLPKGFTTPKEELVEIAKNYPKLSKAIGKNGENLVKKGGLLTIR